MSCNYVYINDIPLPKSVIGLLDGTETFCIANPYFNVPGVNRPDKKSFLAPKTSAGTNKFNVYFLNSPAIYIRTMTGSYTTHYAIGYIGGSGSRHTPKRYYVRRPFDVSVIQSRPRHKINIAPANNEIGPEDLALAQLDYQFTMVMDVLTISKILDIDLSIFAKATNEEFYPRFVAEINRKLPPKATQLTEPLEPLIESFDRPPIYGQDRNGTMLVYDVGAQEPAFTSLFQQFYMAIARAPIKTMPWSKIMSRPSCIPTTSIRFVDRERKSISDSDEPEHAKYFDCKLTFLIQLDPEFSSNIPESLTTRIFASRTSVVKMNKDRLANLWGGERSDDDGSPGCTQEGCIYIVPSTKFMYCEKGAPTVEWRVEKVATKRVAARATGGDTEGSEFMGGDDDDMPPRTRKEEGGEFFGANEMELDADDL